jgi:hypothetical protein
MNNAERGYKTLKRKAMSQGERNVDGRQHHSLRRHLCRIRRKQHAELATVLSHLSDISHPCRFDPLTRHHRCRLCGRIDVLPGKTPHERIARPRAPTSGKSVPPCPAGRLCGDTSLRVEGCVCLPTFNVLFSRIFTADTCTLRQTLPDFDWLRRLEPRHQGPPRHCPAAESSFIVQHRDHKLTVKPRLMAAGGRLRLVRKSVERHRFTVSA